MCVIWQCSVATKGGVFVGKELLETTPQLLPQFYHKVLYLVICTAQWLFLCLPCVTATPSAWLQYSTEIHQLVSSDKSTCSNVEHSTGQFILVPEYMWRGIFLWYKNWHSKESKWNCAVIRQLILFVGSSNAKLTSKDERFQDHRNFSSRTQIPYWEGQTVLRYYIGLLMYINVLPFKLLCPVKM